MWLLVGELQARVPAAPRERLHPPSNVAPTRQGLNFAIFVEPGTGQTSCPPSATNRGASLQDFCARCSAPRSRRSPLRASAGRISTRPPPPDQRTLFGRRTTRQA